MRSDLLRSTVLQPLSVVNPIKQLVTVGFYCVNTNVSVAKQKRERNDYEKADVKMFTFA